MRSLKAVIVRAGFLKKNEPLSNESDLVINAIKDCIIPVFISSDIPLFT